MGFYAGRVIYGIGEREGIGAYTRANNENFNFFCNMKLLQIITTAQQLMVSPYQSKGQIRRFHRFHLYLYPHPHRPATLILHLQIVEALHSFECHQCSFEYFRIHQELLTNHIF